MDTKRFRIVSTTYRKRPGWLVTNGRQRVFVETREQANEVKRKLISGEDITTADLRPPHLIADN